MGRTLLALFVLLATGCSSAETVVSIPEDAGSESPGSRVYPAPQDPGGQLCGWVRLPPGGRWVFLPCSEKSRDPVSDRPEEDPPIKVPAGWLPPGPPGDPTPW